jgi:hypothetical protein
MIGIIAYSIWLQMSMNHSYFISLGLDIPEPSRENFLDYIFNPQLDYLFYVGPFLIGVFFIGLFMGHMVLRPFNQVEKMCQNVLGGVDKNYKYEGLNSQKLLIILGHFISDFVKGKKQGKTVSVPSSLEKVNGPVMDWVFYFQFLCMMIILTVITVTAISVFTAQLHQDVIQVALTFFKKPPKGIDVFLLSQNEIIDLIILVPSLISCVLYALIARLMINKVEGVTYAYIRDVKDVARGDTQRRIRPRADDPGRNAALAINSVLDELYPRPREEVKQEIDSIPFPSPI